MSNSFNSEDSFRFNCMLASALCQLMNVRERVIIRLWLEKLKDSNQRDLRTDYMWCLMRLMQKRSIPYPFNCEPFEEDLQPLANLLPEGAFDDLTQSKTELAWMDEVGKKPSKPKRKTILGPAEFIKSNPQPKRGIMCYMAAFSDPS